MTLLSIGEISVAAGIKVPTIRYYEGLGLVTAAMRTAGNQRRYSQQGLERLLFIRHARNLGFSLDAITRLIELNGPAQRDCSDIDKLAGEHLAQVKDRISRLKKLEAELERIVSGCNAGHIDACYVIESLANHDLCDDDHST